MAETMTTLETREGVACVVAVLENRAREVGLAALNLEAPVLALSQSVEFASFTNALTLLQQHAPDVILTCASAVASSQLLPLLTKLFGSARFVALPRSSFDDTRGRSTVRLVATATDKDIARAGKALYLAFAAADACVRFCGDELKLLMLPDSLRVHHELSGRNVFIDNATVEHLELLRGAGGTRGLLGTFSKTATKGGAQLLKASLLQPLRDVATIDARLDALDEILRDETLFIALTSLLSKVPKARNVDLSRTTAQFSLQKKREKGGETRALSAAIQALLDLRSVLAVVPMLRTALSSASTSLLTSIRDVVCAVPALHSLDVRIDQLLDDEVCSGKAAFITLTQQVFAIRAGVDGFLDVARKTYCTTTEAIQEHGAAISAATGLAIKVTFQQRKGFSLNIPAHEFEAASPGVRQRFAQATKKGRTYTCSTGELNGLNMRLQDVSKDALLLSIMVADGVMVSVRDALPALTAFSEAVSLLDVIVNAFAATVSGSTLPFVRPRLTVDGPLAISNGRHPVACAHLRAEGREFVANSTFLSDAASFVVITGANMSGKTTYLKQVAVNAVLAHAGCFVAAEFASFRLLDRLFSRLGSADDCANSSTFTTECRELASMLQHATKNSLCIIDELGRATSTSDGFAIAFAASEHLLSAGAFTLCATHMERLADLGVLYAGAKHCHLRVVNRQDGQLHFAHELTEGSNTFTSHYGILLGRTAGLPAALLDRADVIVSVLESKQACASGSAAQASVFSVAQRLLSIAQSPAEGEATVRDTLRALRAAAADLPA